MRIFIAGATGTLGRPVVRRLVSLGHEVVGLTRSEKGARALEAAGARGVVGDALDREGLRAAVDDEPMPLQENLTLLAQAICARPPRLLPGWLVRLAAPVVAELGSMRLVLSNAKARRELGWAPRYPDARAGLAELSRALEEAA